MDFWRPDLFWPVFGALSAGAAIGFEREFRARAAGFRTHILVALAAALLMLAAQHQVEWAGFTTPEDLIRIDPSRMAHGILTGIGFLCGGVIFKSGFSIHGLTTAASLWTTSALGVLFGVGFYGLAIGATLVTLVVLTGFRFLSNFLPSQSLADATFRFRRGAAPTARELRAEFAESGVELNHLGSQLTEHGEIVEFTATLKSRGALDIEDMTRRMLADARIVEYAIERRTN
jgi:putative Mg2+ transporter-C (MgtC) family protein